MLAGRPQLLEVGGGLMVVAVPVFFVAMPWLIRIVFGQEYDGAVHAARVILLAAAIHFVARLDEVAAGHDRAAASADRDAWARDDRRDPAGRAARRRMGGDGSGDRRPRLDGRVRRSPGSS